MHCFSLEELRLDRNLVTALPSGPYKELKVLSATQNRISEFPTFLGLTGPRHLIVSGFNYLYIYTNNAMLHAKNIILTFHRILSSFNLSTYNPRYFLEYLEEIQLCTMKDKFTKKISTFLHKNRFE